MKLSSGKRIGQSGQELTTAAVLSFALHTIILTAAALIYFSATPRVYVPPFYNVKLVGLPADLQQPAAPAAPAAPPSLPKARPEPRRPEHKAKKNQMKDRRAPAKPAKSSIPDLAPSKQRPAKREPEKTAEAHQEQPENSKPVPAGTGDSGAKAEKVTVTMQQDAQFPGAPPYMAIVRERIGLNWNPPPGAADIRAKVQFTILRSGRIGDVKLADSSGNFYFDQAAMRAILSSSPFPPLPDGFYKDFQMFTVDLMEKE